MKARAGLQICFCHSPNSWTEYFWYNNSLLVLAVRLSDPSCLQTGRPATLKSSVTKTWKISSSFCPSAKTNYSSTTNHSLYRLYDQSQTVTALRPITVCIGSTTNHSLYRLYDQSQTVTALRPITVCIGSTTNHSLYRLYDQSQTVSALRPITVCISSTTNHSLQQLYDQSQSATALRPITVCNSSTTNHSLYQLYDQSQSVSALRPITVCNLDARQRRDGSMRRFTESRPFPSSVFVPFSSCADPANIQTFNGARKVVPSL